MNRTPPYTRPDDLCRPVTDGSRRVVAGYPSISLGLDPIAETICGVITLVATQDIGGVRPVTGYIDIPRRWLEVCTPRALEDYVERKLDRVFRPWNYPDQAIAIRFEPFPRWARLIARIRQLIVARLM
jgi:hypothetical protein